MAVKQRYQLDRRAARLDEDVNSLPTATPFWSTPLRPDRILGFDFDPLPGVVIFELRGA
jgi:hypothetical protein